MPDLADARSTNAGLGVLAGLAKATGGAGADVLVDVGGVQVTAHTLRSASVTNGDPLLIARQGSQYWVLGPTNVGAPAAVPETDLPPAPKPTIRTGKLIVSPIETRSYRDGRWRTADDDTYQGDNGGGNYTGAAFYGNKPASLTGATCTKAYLRLRRRGGLGDYTFRWVKLWTVEQRTRPTGAVTRVDNTDGPGLRPGDQSTWQLPTSWGQSFIDGDIGGLACHDPTGANYMGLSGRGGWSAAWTLSLYWRKVT